jgi:hypothetical protein
MTRMYDPAVVARLVLRDLRFRFHDNDPRARLARERHRGRRPTAPAPITATSNISLPRELEEQ